MPDVRVSEYLTHCRSLYDLNQGVPPGGYTTFRAFDIFKCQEWAKLQEALLWAFEMVQSDLLYIKAPVMSFEDYVRLRDKSLNFRAHCYKQFKANGNQPPQGGYTPFEDFT
jgi:hypothetical protein